MFNSKFGFITQTGDPALLFNFNGENASQVFNYSSKSCFVTPSANGTAQNSTNQSKYGGASAYFEDGPSAVIVNGFPAIGTKDFTIDFWLYLEAVSYDIVQISVAGQISKFGTIDWGILYTRQDPLDEFAPAPLLIFSVLGIYNIYTEVTINDQEWTYIAFTRSNNTLRTFVNGALLDTTTDFNHDIGNFSPLAIGGDNDNDSYGMIGYIDDFRIITGSALYTSDFSGSVPNTQATL